MRETQTSVPVEDLRAAGFGDEVEKVATAVAGYLDDGVGSNVAVVSDPYAGRDSLLTYAESLLDGDVVRVDLDPSAADGAGPELPTPVTSADGTDRESADSDSTATDSGSAADGESPRAGAVIVTNCHYLFERRIDGFAALDAFLDRIALSETLVITSWNRHAWSYLDAVRDVGDTFPTVVEIPRLDAEETATVIEAHYGPDLPVFVETGRAGRVKTVVFDAWRVGVRGRSVAVPYPRPNPAWTASWSFTGEDEGIDAVVFEKLRRVSAGNPGVAIAVWEDSVEEGEIAPGYIEAFEPDLTLDDDAAVLLWTLVAQESVRIDRLAALFEGRPVEAVIQGLVERGLVTVEGDRVTVPPRALHPAAAALERWGVLW
ncbi:MAG: hypothetical protein V5A44_02975 [Haloarculaceae archaeon]